MRQPSIHITKKQLASLLQQAFAEVSPQKWTPNKLADYLLSESINLSLTHRSVYVTNDKVKRDVNKITLAGRSQTSLFGEILIMKRHKLKHRGLSLPKPGTPEFLNLKEATKLAVDFSREFGLKTKEGFTTYIDIALKKLRMFSLNRFPQIHAAICREYELRREISEDPHPEFTAKLFKLYDKLVLESTGISSNYEDDPEKYIFFVRAAREAKTIGTNEEIYIRAQFYGFEWASTIPTPNQLVGTGARQRVIKYCSEKSISVTEQPKRVVNFSKIKKGV